MKKLTILSLSTALVLSLTLPAIAGPGHDHSSDAHDHAAEAKQEPHDHAHDDHFVGKAGDFASTKDALVALKMALKDANEAVEGGNLEAIHEIYPRIEAAGAYIHDYAKPASESMAERFHASVDQMMGLVSEMHDTSHSLDKAGTERLLKKANGAVMLVENFLPAFDRAQ